MNVKPSARLVAIRTLSLLGAALSAGWGIAQREMPAAAAVTAAPAGPITVWFSQPDAFTGALAGGPEESLVRAIDEACCTADVASYDFDLLPVARALARAAGRGVRVRLVADSDNLPSEASDLLRAVGVPVHGDTSPALMHDKFVILDSREVWAGSMNLTVNDAYRNNNNFARLESTALAGVFTAEFEEMFTTGRFGAASPHTDPAPGVNLDGAEVRVYFAPEDAPAGRLVEAIRAARRTIHVMAFSFTSQLLAAAALERARAGVEVIAVLEKSLALSSGERVRFSLLDAGLEARLDGNPRNMHHKVIVLDGETVVFGSYNFSENAETRNDEVTLIVRSRRLAAAFEEEFRRVLAAAIPPGE